MSFRDQVGRAVSLKPPARRIVSLVPSQTELLFDLGVGDRVVGVTRYCVEPARARERAETVGGTKRVHLDRVRALEPDLVLANREENTPEIVETLEAEAPVWVSDVRTLGDALAMIRSVGELVGRESEARELAERAGSVVRETESDRHWRVAYPVWTDPWHVAAGDTFIDHMLARAGLLNVFGDLSRYPHVDGELLSERRTEVLLLPDEPFPFDASHVRELSERYPTVRVVALDGKIFSWYGSRLLRFRDDVLRLRRRIGRSDGS